MNAHVAAATAAISRLNAVCAERDALRERVAVLEGAGAVLVAAYYGERPAESREVAEASARFRAALSDSSQGQGE
jgi:hypothetical protein